MLYQLNPSSFESVRNLFPKHYPDLPFIYAVIENKITAEIWVDNTNHPQFALILSNFYLFIAGKTTQALFAESYRLISEKLKFLTSMNSNVKTHLSLICPPEMQATPIDFEKLGFVCVPRIEYKFDKNTPLVESQADTDYQLIAINQSNISKCIWHAFMPEILGSENLHHHLGYMLWDKQAQCSLSEAYGVVGGNLMEIMTVTHPSYTQKGFSSKVCSHLINEARKKGLEPFWLCSKVNIASNKTAKRIGMVAVQEYAFLNLERGN